MMGHTSIEQIAYSDVCDDCRAVVYDVGRYELQLCSKHAAADDLLRVARQVEHIGQLADDPTCPDVFLIAEVQVLRNNARAAIAATEDE